MVAVANSTPLIALSKIGLFELLKEYFDEVIIPNEVDGKMRGVVLLKNLVQAKGTD